MEPIFDLTGWLPRIARLRALGELLILVGLGMGLLDGMSASDLGSPALETAVLTTSAGLITMVVSARA